MREEHKAPDIGPHEWLIEAFYELSTDRQIGMDVGPIPISSIHAYADRHELGDLFVRQILEIDRNYMALRAKKVNSNG